MTGTEANRLSIEKIMEQDEGLRLSPDGIRKAFEDPSAPVFADQVDYWLPDSRFVHDQMLRLLSPVLGVGENVLDLGAGTGRRTSLCSTFQKR